MSLRTSLHALTALDPDGKPLAMLGLSPVDMLAGRGSPWFLGSDSVFDHGRELLTMGPRIIAWFHETFPLMENMVSSENVRAIALLKRWGAEIVDQPKVVGGVEFVPFRFSAAIQGASIAA